MAAKQSKASNCKYIVIDFYDHSFSRFTTVETLTQFFKDIIDEAGILQFACSPASPGSRRRDVDIQNMLDDDFLVLDRNLDRVPMQYECKTEIVALDPKEMRPAAAARGARKK